MTACSDFPAFVVHTYFGSSSEPIAESNFMNLGVQICVLM